jgi:beta-lactamase superfamily II metal-dependent hydrolase
VSASGVADEARPRSRTSLQLNAIDADAFDSDLAAVDDNAKLLLARVSSTPNRLGELFGIELPKDGDWFEIELERRRSRPRGWLLPLNEGYRPRPQSNVVAMRQLRQPDEIVARLDSACVARDAKRLESGTSLEQLLSLSTGRDLRITVLDVGQADCIAFASGSQPFGYFDVGAPMFFNQRSFPRRLDHQLASDGFVILSHWDFDHFALAIKFPQLKRLQWFAPNQPVGPNTVRFQKSLGTRLNFISGDMDIGSMMLRRCSGTSTRDRNSTGYALRVNRHDARILLPGDADYQYIAPAIVQGANRIVVPHHGAKGSIPPSPNGGGKPLAVVSYGVPNTYRHPNENQIDAHRRSGWPIRRTAAHGNPARPRGNRDLYPV